MSRPVCVVVGVGPGNGAAFARKFSDEGYAVALLARNQSYLDQLEAQVEHSKAYRYDATDLEAIPTAFAQIRKDQGPISVLVYNAGSGMFGHFDQVTAEELESAWRVNVSGCFGASREVVPEMRERGEGNIVIIGATASLRGGENFTAFASAKAAQRSLAQSMARHLGREKIHVSYLIIDGVIDMPRSRGFMPDASDEDFLKPDDIALAVHNLVRQPESAWTFELDVRPYREKW